MATYNITGAGSLNPAAPKIQTNAPGGDDIIIYLDKSKLPSGYWLVNGDATSADNYIFRLENLVAADGTFSQKNFNSNFAWPGLVISNTSYNGVGQMIGDVTVGWPSEAGGTPRAVTLQGINFGLDNFYIQGTSGSTLKVQVTEDLVDVGTLLGRGDIGIYAFREGPFVRYGTDLFGDSDPFVQLQVGRSGLGTYHLDLLDDAVREEVQSIFPASGAYAVGVEINFTPDLSGYGSPTPQGLPLGQSLVTLDKNKINNQWATGVASNPQTGDIPQIYYDVYIDPDLDGGLSLDLVGNNWNWDRVYYSTIGLKNNGTMGYIDGPYGASSGVTLDFSLNSYADSGVTDFNTRVIRNGGTTTDYFDNVDQFLLTSLNDTVSFNIAPPAGANNEPEWNNRQLLVDAQKGNDNFYFVGDLGNANQGSGQFRFAAEERWTPEMTQGIWVNLSGHDISRTLTSVGAITLQSNSTLAESGGIDYVQTGSRLVGQVLDQFGYIDNVYTNFTNSGAPQTASAFNGNYTQLGFDGTSLWDRYFLDTQGMEFVDDFFFEASLGNDYVSLQSVGSGALNLSSDTVVTTMSRSQGTSTANVSVLGESIVYASTGSQSFTQLQVKFVGNPAEGYSAELYAIFDPARYPLATQPLKVATEDVAEDGLVTFGKTFANVPVSATQSVDVAVTNNFKIYVDDVSHLSGGSVYTVSAQDHAINADYIRQDATDESLGATAHFYYRGYDDWDNQAGVSYYNRLIWKDDNLGYDRLSDDQFETYVNDRSYTLTDLSDFVYQTDGLKTQALSLNMGDGADRMYYVARSGDMNELVTVDFGRPNTDGGSSGPDGYADILDVDLGKLDASFGSTQKLILTNVDSVNDQVRFLNFDASQFFVRREGGASNADPVRYVFYKPDVVTTTPQGGGAATTTIYNGEAVLDVQIYRGDNSGGAFNTTPQPITALPDLNAPEWGNAVTNTYTTVTGLTPTTSGLERVAYKSTGNTISMTSGNDSEVIFDNSGVGKPFLFGAGDDSIYAFGEADIGLGAGDDFVSVRNNGQQVTVIGGAGVDTLGLSGSYFVDANGVKHLTDWDLSSVAPVTVQTMLAQKYLPWTGGKDLFEVNTSAYDKVYVLTNRLDGTQIFAQVENLSFASGEIMQIDALAPPTETGWDFTVAGTTTTPIIGSSATVDTFTLKVADATVALKNMHLWLDTQTTSKLTAGPMKGTQTILLKGESTNEWFSGAGGHKSADVAIADFEVLRITDGVDSYNVRIVGSNGYASLEAAMNDAQRGDTIFMAETTETVDNGVIGFEKASFSVTVDAGLRVLFEDDSLRTNNKLSAGGNFVVNMTDESLEASNSQFLGNHRALQVLGDDAVNINGSDLSEIIIGNDGANLIKGGGGNDYIVGNSGADILLGQAGNDVIVGGSSARVFSLGQVDSIDPWANPGEVISSNRFEVDSESWLHEMSATNGFVKFTYSFSGGTGISYYTTPSATTGTEVKSGTTLYGVVQQDGGHHYIKFATSEAFAKAGNFLDISSLGTATRHNVIVDYTYTTGNGDDYISGGSGNDVLVSYGVQGSLTATTKDTVTALGGSGADTMIVMASTGVTNFFGGSGADTFVATDEFLGTIAKNKQATFYDFSSVTDNIAAPIDFNDVQNMQATLAGMEVNLTPLVPPEVKVIEGSGEDGNYVDYRQDESIYSSNNEFVDLVWSVDPNIGLAEILAA